ERLLVLVDRCETRDRGVQIGLTHLDWVDDRQLCLVFQRLRPAIPELRLVVESVENSGRVPLAHAAVDTYGRWLAICECALGIMAAGASGGSIRGQTAVEE